MRKLREQLVLEIVRLLLKKSGFVINEEKTIWEPVQCMTWLGVTMNLVQNTYKINPERISSIILTAEFLLKSPYTAAGSLSRLTGKIVSTKYVLSNIVRLKTRSLYNAIDDQLSWDSRLKTFLIIPKRIKRFCFGETL